MNFRQRVTLRVPGTCGELIQSRLAKRECLIALPVNRYVTAEAMWVTSGADRSSLMSKSQQAFELITAAMGLLPEEKECIQVSLTTQLHLGKGMASSTADIFAVMASVVLLCRREHEFEASRYGRLCAMIEPTDGLMFEHWSLFDHLSGELIESFHKVMPMTLYMLYPEASFQTVTLRGSRCYEDGLMTKSETLIEKASRAIQSDDYELLGHAMTQSAFENEIILSKVELHSLYELGRFYNALGVVCAHSGTVLGIAFREPSETFEEALNQWFMDKKVLNQAYYCGWEALQTVQGGYQVIAMED